jgi:hypothetical protein
MKKQNLVIFLAIAAFAWYTDHRWEDWYITYRASKNEWHQEAMGMQVRASRMKLWI